MKIRKIAYLKFQDSITLVQLNALLKDSTKIKTKETLEKYKKCVNALRRAYGMSKKSCLRHEVVSGYWFEECCTI